METGNKYHRLSLFLSFLLHIYIVLFWLVSTLFSCQNCVSLRCCSFVEPFVVGLEFAVANFLIVQVKIKIIAELKILKARCKNLQFTCAILIVSSRQNCRGHIMHHHDTFHKMLPPPLGTRINNTVPALKTTTVNRPVPALKNKRPSPHEQKIQPPGPGTGKTQPPRPVPPPPKNTTAPVPPRKKNTTAPSRLGKQTTAPSRFGKKKRPPRPVSERKNNRPVPPRKKKQTVPSRQEFPPLYFASPALPPK